MNVNGASRQDVFSTPSPNKNKPHDKKVANERRPIILTSKLQDKQPEIKLGGVFLDHAERTAQAEAKSEELQCKVEKLEHERSELKQEIENLKNQWRATADECMSKGSTNTELSEVLQHLQFNKIELENQVRTLTLNVVELEAANRVLEDYKMKSESKMKTNEMNKLQLEHIISVEKEENNTLTTVIYAKDEEIADKMNQLVKSKNEVDILKKSIITKDRQLASVVKDRDRNRDALLHAKKAMLPKQREALRGISGQQSSSINIGSYDVSNTTNRRDQAETGYVHTYTHT